MTGEIVDFPTKASRDFEDCVDVFRRLRVGSGIIIGYDGPELIIRCFGGLTNNDALWLAEQMKRHALGDEAK